MRKTEKSTSKISGFARTSSAIRRPPLRQFDDNVLDQSEYFPSGLKSPHRKIFMSHISQYQGHTPSNIAFRQLDPTLVPEFLQPFKCGCHNTLEPCSKITHMVKVKLEQMKKEYEAVKRGKDCQQWEAVGDRLTNIPVEFPEVLLPQLQNILRIADVPKQSFVLLCYLVAHSKLEYLSYWLFKELTKIGRDLEQDLFYIHILANKHSTDVISIYKRNQEYFETNCKEFLRTMGTSLIPVQRYAEFLYRLSKYGRKYFIKVLFCSLLYHKQDIINEGKFEGYFRLLTDKSGWNKIFSAAESPLINI